jgi:hypothetical protein
MQHKVQIVLDDNSKIVSRGGNLLGARGLSPFPINQRLTTCTQLLKEGKEGSEKQGYRQGIIFEQKKGRQKRSSNTRILAHTPHQAQNPNSVHDCSLKLTLSEVQRK